jgi:hypothetical protein
MEVIIGIFKKLICVNTHNVTGDWGVPDVSRFLGTTSKIRILPRYSKRATKSRKIVKRELLEKQNYTLRGEVAVRVLSNRVGLLGGRKRRPSPSGSCLNGLISVQWLPGSGKAYMCTFDPLCPSLLIFFTLPGLWLPGTCPTLI